MPLARASVGLSRRCTVLTEDNYKLICSNSRSDYAIDENFAGILTDIAEKRTALRAHWHHMATYTVVKNVHRSRHSARRHL